MTQPDTGHIFPGVDPTAITCLPVLDRFHEGIMIIDGDGRVRYMNTAQARIDDLEAADAIGKKVTDLYRVDAGTSPTMTCLKSGRPIVNLACYYRTHLGKIVNSIHNVYPIRAHGKMIGALCCIANYKSVAEPLTPSKPAARRALSTYGVSPDAAFDRDLGNGTRFTFDDIIGQDAELQSALKAARLAASSPSPIMLCGETGTGKELFAQSIHNGGGRSTRPYLGVNCTAIPENLLEGMLFGTARGAFTGAVDKAGLLEEADGGTVFLDEIDAMSPGLQAKLLRFLQERKVRRVGAIREIPVDLKIISGVGVPPHTAIDAGHLRADLFYRLAVVCIQLPPLRKRKGDLNHLIDHFLLQTNARLGKRVTAMENALMAEFKRYSWPGNVRELAHVIEGAMNMMATETIMGLRHLTVPLRRGGIHPLADRGKGPSEVNPGCQPAENGLDVQMQRTATKPLPELKRRHEIEAISAALAKTGGNAAKAARHLGISAQSMNYKLKRFDIDRRSFIKS